MYRTDRECPGLVWPGERHRRLNFRVKELFFCPPMKVGPRRTPQQRCPRRRVRSRVCQGIPLIWPFSQAHRGKSAGSNARLECSLRRSSTECTTHGTPADIPKPGRGTRDEHEQPQCECRERQAQKHEYTSSNLCKRELHCRRCGRPQKDGAKHGEGCRTLCAHDIPEGNAAHVHDIRGKGTQFQPLAQRQTRRPCESPRLWSLEPRMPHNVYRSVTAATARLRPSRKR